MPSLTEARSINAAAQLKNPVAVVLGGTSGVGAGLAYQIAHYSSEPHIHLIGRSQQGADQVIKRLETVNPKGTYQFHQCDVSLQANVRALATKLRGSLPVINYLVLSAGMLTLDGRTETSEGLDVKMACHLYSRVSLARSLAPSLVAAATAGQPASITSVLDSTHSNIDKIDFADLDLKKNFGLIACANHCIAMTDVYLQDIARKNPTIAAIHAYPGFVGTNIARGSFLLRLAGTLLFKTFGRSPDDCADYLLSGIVRPEHKAGFFSIDDKGDLVSGTPQASPEQAQKVLDHLDSVLAA